MFARWALFQYLRVASDTDVGGLVDFAVQHWRLPQPKMVISITGGAGHLKMDKKLIEGLKKGLMKVAVSTGIYISFSTISDHRAASCLYVSI